MQGTVVVPKLKQAILLGESEGATAEHWIELDLWTISSSPSEDLKC